MTAFEMDDDFDPEELAKQTADRAYLRVVIGKSAALLAVMALALAFMAGDYVFGAMALWLVPRTLSWALAAFMAIELYVMAEGFVQSRRKQRGQDAGLSEGERTLASLDELRTRPPTVPWWRAGANSSQLWLGLVMRAIYSACAGLVLVTSFGTLAGFIAGAAFTVGVLVLRASLTGLLKPVIGALTFVDPRPPRDTPEL